MALAFCLTQLLGSVGLAQDSMNVRRVGTFATAPNRALDVAVSGDYAYVIDDSLFHIVSVADPTHPVQVGCVEAPGYQVAVQGDHAYVVSGRDGLRVVSVADPASPVEVGHCDTPDYALGVAVNGDYAYVAELGLGLRVISVADPANPVEVARIDTFGITQSVAVSGDYAYVGAKGLRIVLVSDPTHPVTVSSHYSLYLMSPYYVDVSGYYAYTVDEDSLHVIRVADPAHPVDVWRSRGSYGGVAVAGRHLYVGAKGVKVFSIADPGRPVEIGHYTIGGTSGAAGVAADSEYAYVACSWAGLQIYQYYGAGVEENHKLQAASHKPATTVVRSLPAGALAFDATGRRVLNPKPGLYFVRSEPPAVGGQPSAVSKVIVTR